MSFNRKRLLSSPLFCILSSMVVKTFSLPNGSHFFFSALYRPLDTDHDQNLKPVVLHISSRIFSALRSSNDTSHKTGYLASIWIFISFSKSLAFIIYIYFTTCV